MSGKWLSKDEIARVAQTVVQIVNDPELQPIKTEVRLRDLIWEKLPAFDGRPIWRGIRQAVDAQQVSRQRYKGFVPVSSPQIGSSLGPAQNAVPVATAHEPILEGRDDGKEKYFYEFVARWFLAQGNCKAHFRKGREWGMPDVSVVRSSVSESIDEVELITVEVKRGNATLSDLTQAYGYSKLGHRCYLASDHATKLTNLREQAEKIGVGLLKIDASSLGRDDIKNSITEVLSPPKSDPNPTSFFGHLSHVFGLVNCFLCGVFFERKPGVTKCVERDRGIPSPHSQKLIRHICGSCSGEIVPAGALKTWRG